jgi:hypothetical protein
MKTLLAIAGAIALICSCAHVEPTAIQGPRPDTNAMGAAAAAELGFHGPVDRGNAQYGR